ncbi:MAG: hypothetical protein RMI79_06340 [Nitrososphaerota archaeon]|nr:hypothetical protein [Nitrososphaerota archaeon]
MRRIAYILIVVTESILTFFKILLYFLWVYLNYRYLSHKTSVNRKKITRALKEEGIPKHVAKKIAEHIFPKMDFQIWQTAFTHFDKKVKLFGEQNR